MAIKGSNVILKIGGVAVAAQTEAQLQAEVEMVQVVPLPGSTEDDGWARFERGARVWGLTNNSFLQSDDTIVASLLGTGARGTAEISVGSSKLSGGFAVTSVSVAANHGASAMVQIQLEGESWPTLTNN